MQEREVVLTKREVEARLVPAGTEIMIPSDTFVTITQSLGGSFTVFVEGNLFRIAGPDADAIGKPTIAAPELPPGADSRPPTHRRATTAQAAW